MKFNDTSGGRTVLRIKILPEHLPMPSRALKLEVRTWSSFKRDRRRIRRSVNCLPVMSRSLIYWIRLLDRRSLGNSTFHPRIVKGLMVSQTDWINGCYQQPVKQERDPTISFGSPRVPDSLQDWKMLILPRTILVAGMHRLPVFSGKPRTRAANIPESNRNVLKIMLWPSFS